MFLLLWLVLNKGSQHNFVSCWFVVIKSYTYHCVFLPVKHYCFIEDMYFEDGSKWLESEVDSFGSYGVVVPQVGNNRWARDRARWPGPYISNVDL
jgi:hypothetical protein